VGEGVENYLRAIYAYVNRHSDAFKKAGAAFVKEMAQARVDLAKELDELPITRSRYAKDGALDLLKRVNKVETPRQLASAGVAVARARVRARLAETTGTDKGPELTMSVGEMNRTYWKGQQKATWKAWRSALTLRKATAKQLIDHLREIKAPPEIRARLIPTLNALQPGDEAGLDAARGFVARLMREHRVRELQKKLKDVLKKLNDATGFRFLRPEFREKAQDARSEFRLKDMREITRQKYEETIKALELNEDLANDPLFMRAHERAVDALREQDAQLVRDMEPEDIEALVEYFQGLAKMNAMKNAIILGRQQRDIKDLQEDAKEQLRGKKIGEDEKGQPIYEKASRFRRVEIAKRADEPSFFRQWFGGSAAANRTYYNSLGEVFRQLYNDLAGGYSARAASYQRAMDNIREEFARHGHTLDHQTLRNWSQAYLEQHRYRRQVQKAQHVRLTIPGLSFQPRTEDVAAWRPLKDDFSLDLTMGEMAFLYASFTDTETAELSALDDAGGWARAGSEHLGFYQWSARAQASFIKQMESREDTKPLVDMVRATKKVLNTPGGWYNTLANEASLAIFGYEKFLNPTHFWREVHREKQVPDEFVGGKATMDTIMLEQLGFWKERVNHRNPFVYRDFFEYMPHKVSQATMGFHMTQAVRNIRLVMYGRKGVVENAISDMRGSYWVRLMMRHLDDSTGTYRPDKTRFGRLLSWVTSLAQRSARAVQPGRGERRCRRSGGGACGGGDLLWARDPPLP
jgi:hypothetical protein